MKPEFWCRVDRYIDQACTDVQRRNRDRAIQILIAYSCGCRVTAIGAAFRITKGRVYQILTKTMWQLMRDVYPTPQRPVWYEVYDFLRSLRGGRGASYHSVA
jgi:hypothetical protein